MVSKKDKKKQRRAGKVMAEQRLVMSHDDWDISHLSPAEVVEAVRSGDKIITRAAKCKQTETVTTEIEYRKKLYEAGKFNSNVAFEYYVNPRLSSHNICKIHIQELSMFYLIS